MKISIIYFETIKSPLLEGMGGRILETRRNSNMRVKL